ncbi:MAG: hypothetical protein A2Y38_24975 [Spirochaetes bacterium GWB1_59_5]|nr:MAG: hypothetical protein A2Y38_24975 [Spirochaetes bacterium GWB1_59_5]
MNFAATESALLILVTLLAREAISLVAGFFFKRLTRDDYVTKKDCEACVMRSSDFITKKDCEACSKQDDDTMARLIDDMSTVKGILLVMAVNQGVNPEELKGLTR